MAIQTYRNYPKDTWKWMWPDVLIRLIPFTAAALLYAHFAGGLAAIGLIVPPEGWPAAIAVGLVVGAFLCVCAIYWRQQTLPNFRLPTGSDQLLQSFFYLAINAPIEEIFWRGTAQSLVITGLYKAHLPLLWAETAAIVSVSIVFGAYHRLGGYPWKFNIAAMLAGSVFGLLYLALPGPSIVAAAIAHGLTTAGYLSWGDAALYRIHIRKLQKEQTQV